METSTLVILFVLVAAFMLYQKWKSSQPFEEYEGNKVVEVKNVADFNKFVKFVKAAQGVMIVDFFATWCPPCRASAPHFGKLSTLYDETKVSFFKVNVDVARDVASQEGISRMPTFKIYKDGKCVKELVGYKEKQIVDTLSEYGYQQSSQ